MFQLDVAKAMNMGATHALYVNSGVSMAHHPTLGIVTADSIKNADKPDTSSIVDNPPVAGSAGASDPNIAGVVRGIRERLLPVVSTDRGQKQSGKTDDSKFNPDDPGATFVSGMVARIAHRSKGR
jgi:hypothetical protein